MFVFIDTYYYCHGQCMMKQAILLCPTSAILTVVQRLLVYVVSVGWVLDLRKMAVVVCLINVLADISNVLDALVILPLPFQ